MTLYCNLAAKVSCARLEKSMETGITIPDHIIEEILLRLPVKYLLRWKCVSKHWYALIWDDDFIKKHYQFHYGKRLAVHGDVPILLDSVSSNSEPTQFRLLLKDGARYVTENITAEFKRDTAHVFAGVPRISKPRCVGLVNGVVCLQEGFNHMALWNPATREVKDVPLCPIMMNYEDGKAYIHIEGFGFDLQSNDFKILGRINTGIRDDKGKYTAEYHMYSLKADSWKRIKDTLRTGICLIRSTTEAYFNGVNYWTAYDRSENWHPRIVSFNFSSKIFKEFELPLDEESWVGCGLRIGKYKEGLALFVDRALGTIETSSEIWAVTKFRDDDNEVPSSWQLVVKVPPFYVANRSVGSILDCGDILLTIFRPRTRVVVEGDGNFATFGAHIYNPCARSFNYLGFAFYSSYRYMESMFPLSRRPSHIDMTS